MSVKSKKRLKSRAKFARYAIAKRFARNSPSMKSWVLHFLQPAVQRSSRKIAAIPTGVLALTAAAKICLVCSSWSFERRCGRQ